MTLFNICICTALLCTKSISGKRRGFHTFRLSDMDYSRNDGCDFLGFKLNAFMRQAAEGGLVESPPFPFPTAEHGKELKILCNLRGYKVRVKWTPPGAILAHITPVHESVGAAVNFQIEMYNFARSNIDNFPLNCGGASDVWLDDSFVNPDTQFAVLPIRTHTSPNFVEETHFLSGQSIPLFHARLREFIIRTPDIMVVLGVKVFRPVNGNFAALACLYVRGPGDVPILTQNVSFGTLGIQSIPVSKLNQWIAESGVVPLSGVGVPGHLPCNLATREEALYVLLLPQDQMLCRNTTPPYQYNVDAAPVGEHIQLRLFDVQRRVTSTIGQNPHMYAAHE